MGRRRLPWLLALPLMVAGTVAAHLFGSALVSSAASATDPDHGVEGVARASHGLLTQAPLAVGVLVAFVVIGLGHRIRSGSGEFSPVWFFLLPPVALVAQEVSERLIHAESFPFKPAHEPALLGALAIQVPFGLAALLIARVLILIADRIGRALAGRPLLLPTHSRVLPLRRRAILRRLEAALAAGHSSRGPPLAVV